MGGRDNWRIWNWPSGVEIKLTAIFMCLNGSLGSHVSFVFSASVSGQFLSNKLLLYSQDQDQHD